MADGTFPMMAADDTSAPVAQPRPPLLQRLWAKVLQGKRMGLTPADLDAYVEEHTGGKLKSVVDLTKAQAQSGRILGEMEASKGPSRALTFMESMANQAGLGIAEKLDNPLAPGEDPAGTRNPNENIWGEPSPQPGEPAPGAYSFLEAGRAEHPWTAVGGEMAGSAIPSTGAGMLAEKSLVPLLYKLPWLSKLLPGVMRSGVRAAVGGAAGSATAAYGASPDITPHPKEIGEAAALGGAVGFPLGAAGGWVAAKLEPSEVLARKAVARSTPDEVPGYGKGKGALLEGTTTETRVGPPDKNTIFTPRPEAEYQQLPEELRPFNAEKSAELRNAASKEITKSPQAAAAAEQLMRRRMTALTTAKQTISKNVETGYKGLLQAVPLTDEMIAELPQDAQRAMNGKTSPTAYDLYGYQRSLGNKADAAFGMKAKGMEPKLDLDQAEAMGQDAATVREWLGNRVKGFNELQAKVQPYLQRQAELRQFMRSIVGRAIKPLGKTSAMPKGGLLEEGVRESYGYEPSQIEERSSRSLVKPFFSTNLQDLFHFVESEPEFKTLIPAIGREAGALAGGPLGVATQR